MRGREEEQQEDEQEQEQEHIEHLFISLNCVLFFKGLKLSPLNCLFSMSLARYQIPFLA